jgi:hypothetical protein
MEGWGGEMDKWPLAGTRFFDEGTPNVPETEPLIPLKAGDKVVSAVLVHPNKVIAVTRHGRVYRIDPVIPSCTELPRV